MRRGRPAQALDRRHVDDRAAPGRGHRLDGHPHAEKRAGEIDVNHLLPLGQIEVLELPECDGSRVVDQHVELAEFADGGRDRGVPLVGFGDVEVHVTRRVAELVGQRLALVVQDVADNHLGAFLDEQARIFGAQAAGPSTDERYLAVYPSHNCQSFRIYLATKSLVRRGPCQLTSGRSSVVLIPGGAGGSPPGSR